MLRAYPIEIVGDIFAVHGPFEQLKHLWNITFVLVPSLRDASNSDGIPPVVKHFIDPTEKLFVLWRKIHCVIPDQLLTMSAMGRKRTSVEVDLSVVGWHHRSIAGGVIASSIPPNQAAKVIVTTEDALQPFHQHSRKRERRQT